MEFLINIFFTFSKILIKINNYVFHRHDVENVNRKHIITYYYNNNPYKIIHKHGRKHYFIEKITSNQANIYEEIKPFLGPLNDFHNTSVTPKDLGYEHLKFEFSTGKILEFTNDEKIIF